MKTRQRVRYERDEGAKISSQFGRGCFYGKCEPALRKRCCYQSNYPTLLPQIAILTAGWRPASLGRSCLYSLFINTVRPLGSMRRAGRSKLEFNSHHMISARPTEAMVRYVKPVRFGVRGTVMRTIM